MQNNIDNFSQFGYTFQVKLLYSLLNDGKFLERVIESLDTKYFENDSFSWIIGTIRDYARKYKSPPTLEALAISIKELPNEVLRETIKNAVKDIFKDTSGLDFVKDKTIEFCQDQALKNAIYQSVDLFQSGKRFEVRKVIDEALKVGMDVDIGHDYTQMFTQRISESTRNTISTGWNTIDTLTDGGLGAGELGVIVAPAGIGKSWALVSMASSALRKGLSVIYYTMELSETYTGLRFDSNLTGIPSQNLKYHQEDVIKKISEIKGNLIIKDYSPREASVQTLKAHFEQVKMIKAFSADIVFVDYADLLSGIGKEKRFVLENIYEDLRALAKELKIPIWTASQANRSSLENDIIEADKVSESYSKIMIADFIMSLSRKVADKVSGTARWHIIKNRFGKDGLTYPSTFNSAIGLIDIQDEQSVGGKETIHKMKDGNDVIRQLLKRKYEELEGGGFE